MLTQYVRRMGL